MSTKLLKKIIISGRVIAETGLMIGASTSAFEIGGTDRQVIRNPINKLPYIPGSSLKGKMRSLFELKYGTLSTTNNTYGPTHNPKHVAAQLFGHIKHRDDNNNSSQKPSRIIVRDGQLKNPEAFSGKTELMYTEVKAENSIDRLTAAANPRFFERVPKGAEFELEMIINVFSNDLDGEKYLDYALEALRLVQDDYLGGGGSRGNGQISFKIDAIYERDGDFYTKAIDPANPGKALQIPQDFKN